MDLFAVGYLPLRVDAANIQPVESEGLDLEMRPREGASVRVEDDTGAPVVGATIAVALESAGLLMRDHAAGRTGSEGELAMQLANPVWIRAKSGSVSSDWCVIRPGQILVLRLPTRQVTLRLVDVEGLRPLEGIPVKVLRDAPFRNASPTISGVDGAVVLALDSRASCLEVELMDTTVFDCSIASTSGVQAKRLARRRVGISAFDRAEPEVVLELVRRRWGVRLLCRDAQTEQVLGRASWRLEVRHAASEAWRGARWREVVADAAGVAWIPSHTREGETGEARLAFTAPGYRRAYLAAPLREPTGNDAIFDVIMGRSQAVGYIHALHEGGRSYAGRLRVSSAETGEIVFDGGHAERGGGWFGPLDIGGGVVVRAMPRGEEWVLSMGDFVGEGGEQVATVTLPGGCGSVLIEGLPRECPELLLVDQAGHVLTPTRVDAEEVHFDSLPSGRYSAGPKAWIYAQLPRFAVRGYSGDIEVSEGKVTLVAWNHAWAMTHGVRGTVKFVPQLSETTPWLYPVYGRLDEAVAIMPIEGWLLGADGGYVVPAGAPEPSALLVMVGHPGESGSGCHPVECVKPGGAAVIRLKTVELEIEPGPELDVRRIEYKIDPARFEVPLRLVSSRVAVVQVTAGVWRIECLPHALSGMRFYAKAGASGRPVDVTDAGGARVKIE